LEQSFSAFSHPHFVGHWFLGDFSVINIGAQYHAA